MKKPFILLALCALLLGVLPTMALATSVEDLTALSSHFPADTVVFAAVRSDDAYLESLNTLLARIENRIDAPALSVQDLFDQALTSSGLTFEGDIRPWLGDSIAIGVRDIDARQPSVLVAVQVTATEPLASLLEASADSSDTEEEYTQYNLFNATARLYGNALLVAQDEGTLDDMGEGDRLTDSEDFTMTLGLLPEPDYNAVVYIQIGEIVALAQEQMEEANSIGTVSSTGNVMQLFGQYGVAGSEAIGLTVINEWGYAIDLAVRSSEDADPAFAPATDSVPLDYGFAANIPADAPLYIQDTNSGTDIRRSIDLIAYALEIGLDESLARDIANGRDVPAFVENIDRNDVRAFIDLSFAGFTGLNLNNDVLANINGNTGAYLRFLPDDTLPFVPDGAVVTEMDSDAAQAIFDSAQNALTLYEANFSVDGNVITLPTPFVAFAENEEAAAALANPAFDVQLGFNDSVFVIGTSAAAAFSLAPDGDTLADDAEFNAAQAYFLEDAETLLYANVPPLVQFIDDEVDPRSSQYGNDVLKVLSMFTSASITSRVDDDGSGVVRMVITLSED